MPVNILSIHTQQLCKTNNPTSLPNCTSLDGSDGMTRRLCAPRALTHRSEALWITDDVLAEAFRRFTSVTVRHGSHVPGPLEAQKRLARRRNTSLARNAPNSINPSLLFADRPQTGWWTSNVPAERKSTPCAPLLWYERPSQEQEVLPGSVIPPEGGTEGPSESDFERRLGRVQTLKDLKTLLHQQDIVLRNDYQCSTLVLRHVLRVRWPAQRLEQYLADPAQHRPQCATWSVLAQAMHPKSAYAGYFREHIDFEAVMRGIAQATRLGMLSADEWASLVDAVCERGLSEDHSQTVLAVTAVRNLIDAFDDCPVLSSEELKPRWWQQLCEKLGTTVPDRTTVQLIWRLRKYSQAASELHTISQSFVSWMKRQPFDEDTELPAQLLLGLPRELCLQAIGSISANLLQSVMQGAIPETVMPFWSKVLIVMKRLNTSLYSLNPLEADAVRAGIGTAFTSKQQLAILAWILHKWYHHKRTSCDGEVLSLLGSGTVADATYRDSIIYSQIVLGVQELPLSRKERLIQELPHLLNRPGLKAPSPSSQHSILKIFERDPAHFAHNQAYIFARENFKQQLTESAEVINRNLDSFNQLIRALSLKHKHTFKVVTRVLENNRPLRAALAASGSPSSRSVRILYTGFEAAGGASTNADTASVDATNTDTTRVDPSQALDTVHTLALAFALTPQLSPRNAFNKVLWCYHFLAENNAPLTPPIARALWHAGVARYGEKGPGNVQLDFVLDKVRLIEGESVAGLLIRSQKAREERSSVFVKSMSALEEPYITEAVLKEARRIEGEVLAITAKVEEEERVKKRKKGRLSKGDLKERWLKKNQEQQTLRVTDGVVIEV